jgi:hypothetical protein
MKTLNLEQSESLKKSESVERQLDEAIRQVHEQGPQGDEYDRDKVRKIAETFSRKYVKLVRTGRSEELI